MSTRLEVRFFEQNGTLMIERTVVHGDIRPTATVKEATDGDK